MQASPPPTHRRQPPRRLYRTTRDKMVAGVAGGLGEYFDIDPVLVRLIWVAAAVLTGGLAIPAYIVMAGWLDAQDESYLRGLVYGRTVASIAESAGYSEREIHRRLRTLYARLGARNRNEAVVIASQWFTRNPPRL